MKSVYVRNVLLTCSSTLALIACTSNTLSAASTSELEQQVSSSAAKTTKQKVTPDNGFTKGVEQILIGQLNLHDVIGNQILRSKEPVLPEQTAQSYENLWFGIDSVK